MMDPELTPAKYLQTLQRFYSIYGPLENEVAAATTRSLYADEAASRQKVQWLIDDLLALGMTLDEIARIPPADAPAFASPAQAIGAMYVMEGATLGGQHITKRLQRDLPDLPRRFFSAYGDDTGRMWNTFREKMQALPSADHPGILQGAVATFNCLEKTFAPVPVSAESQS